VPRAPSSTGSAPLLAAELIRALGWKRFELLVTRYLAATGVQAALTGPGADGGVDVGLTRAGESRPFGFVRGKAWGSERIGRIAWPGSFTLNVSKPILPRARSPAHRVHRVDKAFGSVTAVGNSVRAERPIFSRKG
jgi:hypothetical protein